MFIFLYLPCSSQYVQLFCFVYPARIVFGFGHVPATVRTLNIRFIKPHPAGGALIFVRSEEVRLLDPVCIFPFSEHATTPPQRQSPSLSAGPPGSCHIEPERSHGGKEMYQAVPFASETVPFSFPRDSVAPIPSDSYRSSSSSFLSFSVSA